MYLFSEQLSIFTNVKYMIVIINSKCSFSYNFWFMNVRFNGSGLINFLDKILKSSWSIYVINCIIFLLILYVFNWRYWWSVKITVYLKTEFFAKFILLVFHKNIGLSACLYINNWLCVDTFKICLTACFSSWPRFLSSYVLR